jgi:hypothetical protein
MHEIIAKLAEVASSAAKASTDTLTSELVTLIHDGLVTIFNDLKCQSHDKIILHARELSQHLMVVRVALGSSCIEGDVVVECVPVAHRRSNARLVCADLQRSYEQSG